MRIVKSWISLVLCMLNSGYASAPQIRGVAVFFGDGTHVDVQFVEPETLDQPTQEKVRNAISEYVIRRQRELPAALDATAMSTPADISTSHAGLKTQAINALGKDEYFVSDAATPEAITSSPTDPDTSQIPEDGHGTILRSFDEFHTKPAGVPSSDYHTSSPLYSSSESQNYVLVTEVVPSVTFTDAAPFVGSTPKSDTTISSNPASVSRLSSNRINMITARMGPIINETVTSQPSVSVTFDSAVKRASSSVARLNKQDAMGSSENGAARSVISITLASMFVLHVVMSL